MHRLTRLISPALVAALGLALAGAASVAGPAHAQQARQPQAKPDRMARLLKAVDKDRDETISLDEAKQHAAARFDRYDTNHDGKLALQEFQAAARAGTSDPQQQERGMQLREKMFRAMDTDHNGAVTKEEYLAAVEARFQKADPDQDGTLTLEELRSPAGRALADLMAP
jgi:Ca2+-binding EF-hand superfamily protein